MDDRFEGLLRLVLDQAKQPVWPDDCWRNVKRAYDCHITTCAGQRQYPLERKNSLIRAAQGGKLGGKIQDTMRISHEFI